MWEVKDFINGGIKKAVENYKNREYKDKKISTIKEDVQDAAAELKEDVQDAAAEIKEDVQEAVEEVKGDPES